MSGNLFTALIAVGAALAGTGCRRGTSPPLAKPAVAVDEALRSEHFAESLLKLGRAHLRGVTQFQVTPEGGSPEQIRTETDVWVDEHGNWRLVELNDHDGGREIVRHGRELAVALRYGKMLRRTAEDPEPLHLLAEGTGGPWAAWELVREVTTVDDFGTEIQAGRKVHVYNLTKDRNPRPAQPLGDPTDRRAWRRTLVPVTIEGKVTIDEVTHVPILAELRAHYTGTRHGPDGDKAITGSVEARASVEEIGTSPAITPPEAEDLPLRQRTVPEEKALLGGLPRSRGTP